MGYMGQEKLGDSDLAADLYHSAVVPLLKKLSTGLKEKANFCNTPGPVNVALIIESGLLDTIPSYFITDHFDYDNLVKELQNLIIKASPDKMKEWNDELNRCSHLMAYQRMLKNVKTWHSKLED